MLFYSHVISCEVTKGCHLGHLPCQVLNCRTPVTRSEMDKHTINIMYCVHMSRLKFLFIELYGTSPKQHDTSLRGKLGSLQY